MSYILLINGPVCAGKSSLARTILKNNTNVFTASFDSIKKNISQYTDEKYGDFVLELFYTSATKALDNGMSILVEPKQRKLTEYRTFFGEKAREKGYSFYEINIEASKETMLKRLEQRVKEGKSINVHTPEDHEVRYELYLTNKKDNIPTYNTDNLSEVELYKEVIKNLDLH